MPTRGLSLWATESDATFVRQDSRRLVRSPVLAREGPVAIDQSRAQIVVRVSPFVTRRPIADFEVEDFLIGTVDEAVTIARASLETGTHAGLECRQALIGVQRRIALEDIDEFILLRVSMA